MPLINDWKMITVPIERDVLASKLPENLMHKIKIVGYTNNHQILVRLHNGVALEFDLDAWMTDECLATIAWEAL
jgi:hypothetical protein